MAEVYFYHLTRSPLGAALPDLLSKIIGRGWRALVRGTDNGALRYLSEQIWAGSETGFLPHGLAGGKHDQMQPVLLTTEDQNTNLADVLLLVSGARAKIDELPNFERVCLMFDGNDPEALDMARADWKAVKAAGATAQYWAQEDGRWVQKA